MPQPVDTEIPTKGPTPATDAERADLLAALDKHRSFLRFTVRDLTDEQAAQRTTVSQLCLGGLIKHVNRVEQRWVNFIEHGPSVIGGMNQAAMDAHARSFQMEAGERLEDLLDLYQETGRAPTNSCRPCPHWTCPTCFPMPLGSHRTPAGRRAGCCCTSSPRPLSTPATPTSCGRPSTVRRRWADGCWRFSWKHPRQ